MTQTFGVCLTIACCLAPITTAADPGYPFCQELPDENDNAVENVASATSEEAPQGHMQWAEISRFVDQYSSLPELGNLTAGLAPASRDAFAMDATQLGKKVIARKKAQPAKFGPLQQLATGYNNQLLALSDAHLTSALVGDSEFKTQTGFSPDEVPKSLLGDPGKLREAFQPTGVTRMELSSIRTFIETLRQLTPLMVNPAPGPRRPLTSLSYAEGPLRWGTKNGRLCLLPTANDDPTALIDSRGLTDVGAMALDPTGITSKDACTVTFIDSTTALTALHCAGPLVDADGCDYRTESVNPNAVVFVPKVKGLEPSLEHCLWDKHDPAKCVMQPIPIARYKRVVATAGRCDGPVPEHDLLIVHLKQPLPAFVKTISGFSFDSPKVAPTRSDAVLTAAGYGYSNKATTPYDMLGLHAGVRRWETLSAISNSNALAWLDPNGAAGCLGDSGGPVFDGNRWGRHDEPRILAAVISSGYDRNRILSKKPPGSRISAEDCRVMESRVISLSRYRSELCGALALVNRLGCP